MKRIGLYSVEAEIGEGGMGTVYRALDPRFGRMVAVKVLHPQFQRDPAFIDRFKKEAVLQAKLSHPNIVSVIDFIADESTLAMVLEYVDGPSMADLIREAGGPIQEARAVRLMAQVLGALHFAHDRHVVHRDIKPANILVVRFGNEEVAKVLDFGIAKIAGDEKGRTQVGAKMGTLGYMAPEQIRSPRDTDRRADVYSAGIVLYELLTGRVPFDADTEYEVMQRIVQETPALGGLPSRIARILERALDKDPGRRFQSAALMRDALVALAAGRVEPDEPSRIAVPLTRHREAAATTESTRPVPARPIGVATAAGFVMIALAIMSGGLLLVNEAVDRWRLAFGADADRSVVAGIPAPVEMPTPPAQDATRPRAPRQEQPSVAVPAPAVPVAAVPPRTAASVPVTGRLLVSSLPWPLTSVSVDGRPVTDTHANFGAGTREARFGDDGRSLVEPILVRFTLAAGQTIDLKSRIPMGSFRFDLEPAMFSTTATLWLGSPLRPKVDYELPVGRYRVSIAGRASDITPYQGEIDITAGVTTRLYKYSVAEKNWTMK